MTSKWRKLSRAAIPLCWVAVAVWLAGCDDDFVVPPVGPEPAHLYFFEGSYNDQIFLFDPVALSLDSFILPVLARWDIRVSPDEKTLYVPNDEGLHVIDLASRQMTQTLPFLGFWRVAVSPDGAFLAVLGDSLLVVRTSDYSIIYSDTNSAVWWDQGRFSRDSKHFFCAKLYYSPPGPRAYGSAFHLDLRKRPYRTSERERPEGAVRMVVPSPRLDRWLLIIGGGRFAVLDTLGDSLIYDETLPGPAGAVVVTPDGRRVVYSYPGNLGYPTQAHSFRIYDLCSNQRVMEVETWFVRSDSTVDFFQPSSIVFTSDGDHMYCTGFLNETGFLIFDARTFEQVSQFDFTPRQAGSLTTVGVQ